MEFLKEYMPLIKKPVALLVGLFFVEIILLLAAGFALGTVAGAGLFFIALVVFLLASFVVVGWAGYRAAKMMNGGAKEGAVAGAITAVGAGLIIKTLFLLLMFVLGLLSLGVSSMMPQEYAAAFATVGFFGVFMIIWGLFWGIIIDSAIGIIFGCLGGILAGGIAGKQVTAREF